MNNITLSRAIHLLNYVNEHGGFTLDAGDLVHSELSYGYMVSSVAPPHRIELSKTNNNTTYITSEITTAINKIQSLVTEYNIDGWYVGGWIDSGFLLIEASEHILSLETAIISGRARQQLSIYDNRNSADILL